ncbi:HNH endonuclease [Hymenobacter terrenus]|uniref:HNH endonuclease n=1 Tax=Hymenobacter terrenus TaxID=1629124 RepID=UPI0012E091BD|nr:HNH endonuclease [Hymenobacter terrenus]
MYQQVATIKTVQEKIKAYGVDTSHFTGAAWNKGPQYRAVGKQALIEHSTYRFTHSLRKRLLKEKLKEHRCENCGLQEWQAQPIPLELHHLNGLNNDHRLQNLQLLCPNCHAQTNSYRGKNQLKRSARVV